MKKFILGLSCGLVIACSSVAFASGSIQALLFPTSFEINGSNIALNNDYKVLNVDGHAYVPIRFIAENLGGTIDYDAELQKIFVKNRNLDLTDPDYKGISVGNLILTKVGNNTRVTGQLRMEGVGNSKNMIGANLSFYNDKSEKIGDVAINGNDFGVESQTFVLEGSGDFRAYSAVNFHIGAVNNNIISEAQSVIYENTKLGFTLKLPKSWEGKYDVVEGTDFISFINIANKEAGWGGVLFTIQIWSKEKWNTDGVIAKQNIHISKIGEGGDEIFTLSTPTDVNYNVNDEKMKAEYTSMWDHINTIKTTFKIKKNLTDNEAKDVLKKLIPKATAIYGMFNPPGWFKVDEKKTIPGEDAYNLVVDENVKSVADLKKVVEDVFTKDIAQKLFYSGYLETKDIGLPLYKDYQGRLYVNTRNGGHGWATKFLIDTAKLKEQKDNVADIELDTTVFDDPYGTLFIKIEYVNGKWLMASGLDDYESIIIHGPKNLDVSFLNISLQPQWHLHFVNNNYSDIIDDKGLKIGWISASNYEKDFDFKQVKPNHSSIIHEESFDIPIGKCDFFTLDVDNGSVASGLTGTHNEYDAVIQIENKVIYIMSFSLNDKNNETKQKFIDILKKIRLKDTLN